MLIVLLQEIYLWKMKIQNCSVLNRVISSIHIHVFVQRIRTIHVVFVMAVFSLWQDHITKPMQANSEFENNEFLKKREYVLGKVQN